MKCNLRRAKQDSVTAAYQTIGKFILAYLDASVGCTVTEMCGFKRKRLQDMYDTTHEYLGYMMDTYAEDGADHRERARCALDKVQKKLSEYASFDFAAATKAMPYEDVFGKTWRSKGEVEKHRTRVQFVSDMELVVQTYHAQLLHWFWLHKGFGHDRLLRLYGLLREDYNLWITEYLRCSAAGDRAAQEMLVKRQDKMEAVGMEFEEV